MKIILDTHILLWRILRDFVSRKRKRSQWIFMIGMALELFLVELQTEAG